MPSKEVSEFGVYLSSYNEQLSEKISGSNSNGSLPKIRSSNDSGLNHPFAGITYKGNWKLHGISLSSLPPDGASKSLLKELVQSRVVDVLVLSPGATRELSWVLKRQEATVSPSSSPLFFLGLFCVFNSIFVPESISVSNCRRGKMLLRQQEISQRQTMNLLSVNTRERNTITETMKKVLESSCALEEPLGKVSQSALSFADKLVPGPELNEVFGENFVADQAISKSLKPIEHLCYAANANHLGPSDRRGPSRCAADSLLPSTLWSWIHISKRTVTKFASLHIKESQETLCFPEGDCFSAELMFLLPEDFQFLGIYETNFRGALEMTQYETHPQRKNHQTKAAALTGTQTWQAAPHCQGWEGFQLICLGYSGPQSKLLLKRRDDLGNLLLELLCFIFNMKQSSSDITQAAPRQHISSCEVNQGQHNYSKEEEHTISGSAELRFLSGFMQLTQSRGAREYGSIMEINDFADPTEGDLFHGERKTTSLRDSKRSVVGSPAQQHSCNTKVLRKCSRSDHNSRGSYAFLSWGRRTVGSYSFLSWGRRSRGHDHCISFCLCWVLLMPMGLSTSWAPLSSIVTQHVITSPPRLRLEPERTLTSQRQLGEPPFPITSTIQSDGIFCKKLKPSVPDDKLVFIRKYKSCVVRLFCTVQFTKLVLVAAAIDRCPVKQDLYCIKMFVILRQRKKKYFHG
ncbi:hypothetical protein Anapl_09670 [Anas platyrhynchos]|uniref:Uncharacterized protein n=1 Tax=Anas platyrhynchos TaxID=8839 RepID=R0KRI7_ANAPL|nr:hypothetical protein Anapl_09670 [Anas platyrhynchos]